MSDPTPTPDPQPDPSGEPKGQQGDPADEPLGDGGKKALEAERALRVASEKQAKELQAQIDKINQANESAVEKAQREAKEAQDIANAAVADALRFRIASEKGITDNVDLILTGSDEETMRKQADLWSARQTDGAPGPRPDLSQGAKGDPATGSPEQDFANFLGRQLA